MTMLAPTLAPRRFGYRPTRSDVRPPLSLMLLLWIAIAIASLGVSASTTNTTNTTSLSDYQPWMACLRTNTVGDVCDVQSVCTRCLRTDGCAFDTLVRECVVMPEDGRALYASSSNSLLNRTNLHYCSTSDPRCASCTVSASNPFCEGTDACVCPSMCVALRTTQMACYAQRQSNMMYISVAVMAVALPLLVVIHRFFTRGTVRGNDLQLELQRMREQRRLDLRRQHQRQRQHQRPASALALQLESWRSHRDEHKVEIGPVEPLKSCYVLMENDDTTSGTTASTAPSTSRTLDSSGVSVGAVSASDSAAPDERRPPPSNVPAVSTELVVASEAVSSAMDPSPLRRAVPKLHLLHVNANNRSLFPKIDSARAPNSSSTSSSVLGLPCSRGNDPFASQSPLSAMERVATQHLYGASVGYLDTPTIGTPVPPSRTTHHKPRPPPTSNAHSRSNNPTESLSSPWNEHEFLILHPSLDLTDDNGELSQLLLHKWSLDAGEHRFHSISLFCEMKLSEVQRMTSWVERPNRFATTACCQLFDKYVRRLEAQPLSPESGASAAFLRKIHDEVVTAIFPGSSGSHDYESCVPYFLELKKLQRHAQLLMANVENREQSATTKEKLPRLLDKLLATHRTQAERRQLATMFRAWRVTAVQADTTRTLKCHAFRASRKLNLSALFRAWRIEALRRAYQRESVELQTMLSITAASLSRKDVQIAAAETKMASMAKIIDSLTESNAQLLYRVEQLEAIASGKGGGVLAALHGARGDNATLGFSRRSQQGTAQFDRIDSLASSPDKGSVSGNGTEACTSAEDEKLDRTNRMLLETMFGMARMVESCAIQLSKDVMDSLEHQLDGAMLQQLADMIHADNVVKIKAEEARGLVFGATPPATPAVSGGSGPHHPAPALTRKMSVNVAFSNSTMLASLGKGAVAVKDLAVMPVDAFLLHWFKMHLQMSSAAEKTSDRTIKNFTSDLADGRRFSFLLHRLFPAWFDANMVHEIDADERLKNIASFHARVQPTLPQVVTSDSIHSGSATENIALTAMLFGLSVQSIRRLNLDRQREKFLNILTSWKRVRSLLLEVKRMNDNYDSLLVVHLLKEMRTCETLFKQLNVELSSIAIASNESAGALSQLAYKALQLTWRCLHAKLTAGPSGVHALELVDERLAERVKDFTHVELTTVRQLLVHDSQYEVSRNTTSAKAAAAIAAVAMVPSAVTEKEVVTRTEAVRDALVVYCKDLHDMFKHYSASGGAGSIASMSLSEFLKFVKDCGLLTGQVASPAPGSVGATKHASVTTQPVITLATIEFIFRAALFFSPLTPREFIVSTVKSGEAAGLTASASAPPLVRKGSSSQTDPAPSFVLPTADPLRPDPIIATLNFGDREMVGSEFVDALLRLAAIKSHGAPASALLENRFRDVMELHILPNALRSQAEIFRAEVASPKVRAVFQKHKPELQRVFRYYTSMHALREQQSTMDLREFLVFARDCKLVGTFVTEHTLKQVLVNLQREEIETGSGGLDDAAVLRVDFSDFQEALAALTEYVICNPYVPLYKRIEQFLHEIIVPRARQKKKGAGE